MHSALALRALPSAWTVLPWLRAAPPAPDVHASEASWGCESALPFLQHPPGALAEPDEPDAPSAPPCRRDAPS